MRGEFIGVWSETWREIWAPLIDQDNVPDDIFCELYRELATALKAPTPEEAIDIVINDPIQRKEAFELTLSLIRIGLDLDQREKAYDGVITATLDGTLQRREALEHALGKIINDLVQGKEALAQVLTQIAKDPIKHAEAFERALEGTINDRVKSMEAFERIQARELAGERAIVTFLETAHGILDDLGGDVLTNLYFNLLTVFIDKYSLRYDLRRPCMLCPTLPGVFSSLVRDLREVTSHDAHLDSLMKEFENAIRDLRTDCSDGRIKTCIQKQVNLLEAIGRMFPGVTGTTLGAICDQVGTWPHDKLKVAIKDLYGFACDYPGIRHGGTPANALRVIEMRDMIAISILLAGFTPYLTDQLNADSMYRGR